MLILFYKSYVTCEYVHSFCKYVHLPICKTVLCVTSINVEFDNLPETKKKHLLIKSKQIDEKQTST